MQSNTRSYNKPSNATDPQEKGREFLTKILTQMAIALEGHHACLAISYFLKKINISYNRNFYNLTDAKTIISEEQDFIKYFIKSLFDYVNQPSPESLQKLYQNIINIHDKFLSFYTKNCLINEDNRAMVAQGLVSFYKMIFPYQKNDYHKKYSLKKSRLERLITNLMIFKDEHSELYNELNHAVLKNSSSISFYSVDNVTHDMRKGNVKYSKNNQNRSVQENGYHAEMILLARKIIEEDNIIATNKNKIQNEMVMGISKPPCLDCYNHLSVMKDDSKLIIYQSHGVKITNWQNPLNILLDEGFIKAKLSKYEVKQSTTPYKESSNQNHDTDSDSENKNNKTNILQKTDKENLSEQFLELYKELSQLRYPKMRELMKEMCQLKSYRKNHFIFDEMKSLSSLTVKLWDQVGDNDKTSNGISQNTKDLLTFDNWFKDIQKVLNQQSVSQKSASTQNNFKKNQNITSVKIEDKKQQFTKEDNLPSKQNGQDKSIEYQRYSNNLTSNNQLKHSFAKDSSINKKNKFEVDNIFTLLEDNNHKTFKKKKIGQAPKKVPSQNEEIKEKEKKSNQQNQDQQQKYQEQEEKSLYIPLQTGQNQTWAQKVKNILSCCKRSTKK